MKYFISVLLIIFLCACSFNGNKRRQNSFVSNNIHILKLENKNIDLLSNFVDSISFLPLKEEDDFLFATINKLIIKENYIYLLDVWVTNSLLVFDNSGNFVRKIGNRGGGPEDYVRLWDFDVDSTGVQIYDRATKQILKYDVHGNFLQKKETPFRADGFKLLTSQKYLFSLAKEDNLYQVILTDSNFQVKSSFFPYTKNYLDNKMTDNVFQEVQDTIFYNKLINDSIYSFSKDGELIGGVLFDFGSNIPPIDIRNDYAKMTGERKRRHFMYFYDTPFRVNNHWVGKMFNGQNKATFLYNTDTDEYYIYDLVDMKINYTDIYMPLFSNKKYIVGWLNLDIYNSFNKKPVLDSAMINLLEEGGHLLCFYYLNY
ncbi:MAG: 6-bladed beta-propeller [Tannerella sp.]|jgi:hypothetical protein|nr:6-bladed beta-propeller [Tannerella sp.]